MLPVAELPTRTPREEIDMIEWKIPLGQERDEEPREEDSESGDPNELCAARARATFKRVNHAPYASIAFLP